MRFEWSAQPLCGIRKIARARGGNLKPADDEDTRTYSIVDIQKAKTLTSVNTT